MSALAYLGRVVVPVLPIRIVVGLSTDAGAKAPVGRLGRAMKGIAGAVRLARLLMAVGNLLE